MKSSILLILLAGTCFWSEARTYISTQESSFSSQSSAEEEYTEEYQHQEQLELNENKAFSGNSINLKKAIDEPWKLEERERLFWVFKDGKSNSQKLEKWQTEQQVRLLVLALKLKVTLKYIMEWQQEELDRFIALSNQKNHEKMYLQDWQKQEFTRITWLIQENGMTQQDLERWMNKYRTQIDFEAHKLQIPSEFLMNYYREELKLLHPICCDQVHLLNSTIMDLQNQSRLDEERYESLDNQYKLFKEHQKKEIDHLNVTAKKLLEQIKLDEGRYTSLQQQYQILKDGKEEVIDQLNLKVNEQKEQLKYDQELYESMKQQYKIIKEEKAQEIDQLNLKVNQQKEQIRLAEERYKSLEQQCQKDANKTNEQEHCNSYTWINSRDKRSEMKKKLDNLEELDDLLRAKHPVFDQSNMNLYPIYVEIMNKIKQIPIKQYRARTQEIEKWIESDLQHFINEFKLNLTSWQKLEKERILELAKLTDKFSLLEFEEQLLADRNHLLILAYQYHVSVKEIEDWIRKEAEELENQGIIGNLKEWQKLKRSEIDNLFEQTTMTIEEFEKQLKESSRLLEDWAQKYKITVEEVEEWYMEEAKRKINHEALKTWQINLLERLKKFIQDDNLTLEELEIRFSNDIREFSNLAVQNQVTIEDIEEFIKNKGQLLINASYKRFLNPWQLHEHEYMLALVQANKLTKLTNFEELLIDDKRRMEKVASLYKTDVNEIVEFWRNEYKRLNRLNVIPAGKDTSKIVEWQANEQIYIKYLLEGHKWSVEELERKLKTDRKRVQGLAYYHDVNINEIEDWYSIKLQQLLREKILYTENLKNWQKIEKYRLYTIIIDQDVTIEEFKNHIKNDRAAMKSLSIEYKITIDELTQWQLKELERLTYLGYGKSISLMNWKNIEKKRLRYIPLMVNITRQELLTFIKSDWLFQPTLIAKYKVSPEELLSIQEEELQSMENDGILENVNLKQVKDWQRQELDRLYGFIRTQNFSSEHLAELQTDNRIISISSLYNIPMKELKLWQKEEMQRIENVAKHYHMDLLTLEDFRDSEIDRLQMVAHKDYLAEVSYNNWEAREMRRLDTLMTQTGLSKVQLDKWRRKLYLLAQGLIDLEKHDKLESNNTHSDDENFVFTIDLTVEKPESQIFKQTDDDDYDSSYEDPFANIEGFSHNYSYSGILNKTESFGDLGPVRQQNIKDITSVQDEVDQLNDDDDE